MNTNISKNLPLVSICILNRNWIKRLEKSLPSILSQNYAKLEFLLLDNNSTDWSLELLKKFKNIKVIESKVNLWISWGRNKIADIANWEYLLFLDNDIEIVGEDFTEKLFNNYKKLEEKNIWVLFPLSRMENDKIYCNVWLYFNKLKKIKFKEIYKTWFVLKPWFEWSAFFIKRSVFNELWWFDEKYPICMNDSDLSMRLYNMGYLIYADTSMYTIHHWVDARTSIENIWWKYQYYLAALLRSVIKNYSLNNVFKWWLVTAGRIFVKAGLYAFKYKSYLPLKWFIISIKNFFCDLSDTLKQRHYWQSKRRRKDDYFLKIE